MRLSDIKGERTLDVIADIIDPIANIAEDPAAADLFVRKKLPDGMDPGKFLLQRARKSVPALLKGHKEDVIAVLAAVEGISQEDYAGALNLVKLFQDCVELMTDKEFLTFFTFARSETGAGTSGSAVESSGDGA